MPLEKTLVRAREDASRGDLGLARRRIGSLVAAFPDRIELRVELAGLCRRAGDPAQAGRWAYLTEDLDPVEGDAFRRSLGGDLPAMRSALSYGGTLDHLGPSGRARWFAVGGDRHPERRGRDTGQRSSDSGDWAGIGCAGAAIVAGVAFLVVVALGIYQAMQLLTG